MKICPLGAALCRADGRTDMSKLIGAFRNFREKRLLANEVISVFRLRVIDIFLLLGCYADHFGYYSKTCLKRTPIYWKPG